MVDYQNCTYSLPNGAVAWSAVDQYSQTIVLKAQVTQQPIVYTDARLSVIQCIYRPDASRAYRDGRTKAGEEYDLYYLATECTLEPI
ncbi:hypothetical protein PHISCL_10672, partial [Aspergillus sclerotialis]